MAFPAVKRFLFSSNMEQNQKSNLIFTVKQNSCILASPQFMSLPIEIVVFIRGVCASLPPAPMVALQSWLHSFLQIAGDLTADRHPLDTFSSSVSPT